MRNGKKVLLVLGAIAALEDIIVRAKKDYYVIVTDNVVGSPAKKFADESWMLSIDDVDGIVQKCREEGVDGVMNFCVDPGQKPYQQICEKLGVPCVAGFEQFDILTNKDKFKACCKQYGIATIPEYPLNGEGDLDALEYPVMIKPADSRASKGLTICHSREEVPAAIEYALGFSKRKKVLAERYMKGCPEVQIKYVACDGEIFLTSTCDWHTAFKADGTRVYVDLIHYPSKLTSEYLATTNARVIHMLKSIGIRNGAVALTALYENGEFHFFDPALRMGGAQDWRIVRAACGIDISDMLINFAMTGSMGDVNEIRKIDGAFAKKHSCLQYFDLETGTIGKITGIEQCSTLPGVSGYLQCHEVGDTIKGYGTTDNIAMRFILTCDTLDELIETMKQIRARIRVENTAGETMLIPPYDPELLRG